MLSAPRAHVYHPVGSPYHLQIVLYDQQRVAALEQPIESPHQAVYVVEMQTRCRLIESEENPGVERNVGYE